MSFFRSAHANALRDLAAIAIARRLVFDNTPSKTTSRAIARCSFGPDGYLVDLFTPVSAAAVKNFAE